MLLMTTGEVSGCSPETSPRTATDGKGRQFEQHFVSCAAEKSIGPAREV